MSNRSSYWPTVTIWSTNFWIFFTLLIYANIYTGGAMQRLDPVLPPTSERLFLKNCSLNWKNNSAYFRRKSFEIKTNANRKMYFYTCTHTGCIYKVWSKTIRDWCYKNKMIIYINSTFNLLQTTPLRKTHTLSSVVSLDGSLSGTPFGG